MPVGRTIVIRGELTAREDLTLLGTVEGSIRVEGHLLTVGESARIAAQVSGATVVVEGTVEGDIAATSKVDVRAGGSVRGALTTPVISVADGASLDGRVDMPPRSERRPGPMAVAV